MNEQEAKKRIMELVELMEFQDGIPSVEVYLGGYNSVKLISDYRVTKILFELKHWAEEKNEEVKKD